MLLFIDGDDPGQKAWAHSKIQKAETREQKIKLILVKGAPLALSEELGLPVYFDQGGILVKKLGIHHVPAVVRQASSEESSLERTSLERTPLEGLPLKELKQNKEGPQIRSLSKGLLLRIEEGGL